MATRVGQGVIRVEEEWRPQRAGGMREVGIALVVACGIAAPILGFGAMEVHAAWRVREDRRLAAIWAEQAYERVVEGPAGPVLAVSEAALGRDVFASTCAACHGPDGKGMKGLGKNLVVSDFVAGKSDDGLRQFIIEGRPDAKPAPMPARAGRDDLTDEDLKHVVVYMRGLQDPRRMPELPAPVVKGPSEEQKAAALQAAGGDAELAKYIASGDRLFHSSCVACHGKGGVGIAGNGKALVNNAFVRSLDDDALLAFIKQGRSPTDPKSTTGIQMPPKGGNPAMTEDDILDVIAYLRTLQGATPATAKAK